MECRRSKLSFATDCLTGYTVPCILLSMADRRPLWDGEQVRALRQHLGMSQQELAQELNVRQQTVSEWETSQYRPRGASERVLSLVAERAGFRYGEPEDR